MDNMVTGGRSFAYPKPYSKYSSSDCTVSGTDWSVRENTSAFDHMQSANDVLIRVSDAPVSLKFNSIENDPILLVDGDYFNTANLTIRDIYVTCSGTATVKVFLMGWR